MVDEGQRVGSNNALNIKKWEDTLWIQTLIFQWERQCYTIDKFDFQDKLF